MESFDARGFARRRWVTVAVTALVCLLLVPLLGLAKVATPTTAQQYVAASSLVVSFQKQTSSDQGISDQLAQTCGTVARLGGTGIILQPVADAMAQKYPDVEPEYTAARISETVRISCISGTSLVESVATLPDRDQALEASQKATDLLREQVLKESSATGVTATYSSPAVIRAEQGGAGNGSMVRNLILAGIAGTFLGCVIALALEIARPRVRTREDVARLGGVPVWGSAAGKAPSDEEVRRLRPHLDAPDVRTVLVTGSSDGTPAALAQGLASSLSAVGRSATVVSAERPGELADRLARSGYDATSLRGDGDVLVLCCPSPQAAPDAETAARVSDRVLVAVDTRTTTPDGFREALRALEVAGHGADGAFLLH